jgi:MFS family permease
MPEQGVAAGAGATGTLAGAPAAPAWGPLAIPLFRALWIASVASMVGTWVQDVAGSWMMTSLDRSPLMVALVQAATTLPIFLFGLPAGALADVIDRRRLLIVTQTWMLLAAGGLGLLTILGLVGPWLLLGLTFLVGLGAALNAPAWQAIIPELVPREQLASALTLNGVGINMARAVGPALGGLVVAAAGPGAAFLLNAVSFVGVVGVLYRWRRPHHPSALPAERIVGAIGAGLRYVRHAPELRAVMIRSASFMLSGSALWALLPIVARFEMGLGPTQYGFLLGCLGAGAVLGAFVLPRVRRAFGINGVVAGSSLIFATALALVATVREFAAMAAAMLVIGGAWITLLTSFHTSAQAVLPAWVRGRALSVYLLVLFGGMAGGSALWGSVATHAGVKEALLTAAFGIVLALAATARHRLTTGEGLDLAPSRHMPAPALLDQAAHDRGPVLVTVEYRVVPERSAEFARAMRAVRRIRLRDGGLSWELFQDLADPARYLESFLVESWIEHLRQHERMTVSDRAIVARVREFQAGPEAPVVTHFIAAEFQP